jgi:hypothetical protein
MQELGLRNSFPPFFHVNFKIRGPPDGNYAKFKPLLSLKSLFGIFHNIAHSFSEFITLRRREQKELRDMADIIITPSSQLREEISLAKETGEDLCDRT